MIKFVAWVTILACLLGISLVVTVWLPWVWALHVDNCRWLASRGDDSGVVRLTLSIDSWIRKND